MDGVLVDIQSSWSYIHEHFGTDNKEIVEAYIQGEIGDKEFINNDLFLWRKNNISFFDIKKIFDDIPLMAGARSTIEEFKQYGITTAILSGGIDILARRIAEETGIEVVLANSISEDMKKCVIQVSPKGKDTALMKLANSLNIPRKNIVSIGNSHYDVKMFQASGMGIAFNPSDTKVEKYADAVVKEKDLKKVVPIVLKFLV